MFVPSGLGGSKGMGSLGGSSKPRPQAPAGGMGQMGGFGEAFDEQSMMQAMSQKQSSQQAAAPVQQSIAQGQGGGAAASDFGSNEAAMQQMQKTAGANPQVQQAPPAPPREVSGFTDELIKRPVADIAEGLKSFFDLNALLGINTATDTPEDQAKKRQIHQRYQQLTQDEQQEAQRQYQEEMERKQKEEQEAEEKRRRKAQESQTIVAPSGQKKGPDAGGGSKKQKAQTKLQNDRKQLGGPGDVG
jgi:hypothetical protein